MKGSLLRSNYNFTPPTISHGQGATLFDEHGKSYIDGSSGAMVANLGHGNNTIAEAASEQIKKSPIHIELSSPPRKDKAASSNIAWAISKVATTMSAPPRLGRILLTRMRSVEQPSDCAAATNSACRIWMTAARVTTAKRSQSNTPSSVITTFSEPPTR